MSVTVNGSNGITFNDGSSQTAAASPFGLKNRIINGDMRIDQRNAGASVTLTNGTITYITDRWNCYEDTSGSLTFQQSSTAPDGYSNSLYCTVASSGSATSAQITRIQQRIEGNNIVDLAWGTASAKTITLSFWVRSSLTGTYCVNVMNYNTSRAYVATYSINAANTWEQKSITIAGDTTGTWLTTNGVGMYVGWDLGSGSNYNTTAGVWQTSEFARTSAQANFIGTASATFYLTGVQLEVGSTATPFERRMYGQELALCQRYYFKDITSNNYGSFAMGSVYSATVAQIVYPHKVTMRTASPTVSVSGVAVQSATTQTANINTVGGSYPGPNSTLIELTVSGFTARDAVWLNSANNGASAFVSLDTEL